MRSDNYRAIHSVQQQLQRNTQCTVTIIAPRDDSNAINYVFEMLVESCEESNLLLTGERLICFTVVGAIFYVSNSWYYTSNRLLFVTSTTISNRNHAKRIHD